MRIAPCAAVIVLLVAVVPGAPAQSSGGVNGAIVAQEPCAPNPITTYESYLTNAKQRTTEEIEAAARESHRYTTTPVYLTKEEFGRRLKETATIDCRRIRYLSDGLQVVAYLWRPLAQREKLPLIIFNRGGSREYSKVPPWHSVHRFALDGFVVIASQYRGNDGGEGKEEYGGADVRDVMNLIPVAASLGYVDMKNIFMLGWSRGGMMTALALKHGMKVNAAAVGGALSNLVAERARRPALGANVWHELIPAYDEAPETVLRERSAVYWADQIGVPLLILQGGADWRADPADALEFAQALQHVGATYELIVYAGDDHGISVNKDDSNRRVVQWFRRYMQK